MASASRAAGQHRTALNLAFFSSPFLFSFKSSCCIRYRNVPVLSDQSIKSVNPYPICSSDWNKENICMSTEWPIYNGTLIPMLSQLIAVACPEIWCFISLLSSRLAFWGQTEFMWLLCLPVQVSVMLTSHWIHWLLPTRPEKNKRSLLKTSTW